MIMATREQHQIGRRDATRLSDLAQFGPRGMPPTMPEARADASKPLQEVTREELVTT
jgi:hypothetical protein